MEDDDDHPVDPEYAEQQKEVVQENKEYAKNNQNMDHEDRKSENETITVVKPQKDTEEVQETKKEAKAVGYLEMFFKHGTGKIKFMVFAGHCVSFAHGAILGLMPIVMGGSIDNLSSDCTSDCKIADDMAKVSIMAVCLGIGAGIFGSFSKFCWTYISNALDVQVKSLYFKKIL